MSRLEKKSYFIPSSDDLNFGIIHKEGRKSLVQDVYLNSKTYIIKEYRFYKRNFNKRFIRRVRDLLFRDYSVKQYLYMKKFSSYGIPTTTPVYIIKHNLKLALIMEKEKIIRYCNEQDINQIIKILNIFHKHGYLHGDPDPNNFIVTNNGILAIDFVPRRNLIGKIGVFYEWSKLFRKFKINNHPLQEQKAMIIVNFILNIKIYITDAWKLLYKKTTFL
jgi:serine/threonine protein kinase